MSKLFIILLRVLFPFDKVGRSREFMRGWLQMVMGWVMDPINIADFEDYPEDRAWLEGHIAANEYGMQVLVWERAREMLGLPFIFIPRQHSPKYRRSKDLRRLVRRLTQFARNFHNLDKLVARVAERMRREHDADSLSLCVNGPSVLMLRINPPPPPAAVEDFVTMLCVLPRATRGGSARLRAETEGAARLRADLPRALFPIPNSRFPRKPRFRGRTRAQKKNPGDCSPGFLIV
jgi:hypothetical protein